jgi:TonB family protein
LFLLWRVRFSDVQAILLICAASTSSWCQANQVHGDLNSEFKGKILVLRNFYSGNDLEYDSNGAVLGDVKQNPWTLSNVKIAKVLVTNHGIEIVGRRMGAWYRDGKPELLEAGKLRVHVSMPNSGAATQATLHPIFNKIFMEAGEDLRPMVPKCWQAYLSGSDSKARSEAWQAMLEKDNNPAILKKSGAPAGAINAPRAISTPDPHYTKEAETHHIEGTSVLSMVVNTNGTASNIAVMRPLGMGLDEQAVLAISQWRFQPGTKDGQPVRVQINVEVTFRCCPSPH